MGVTWMGSHICEERNEILVLKHHGSQISEMARMFHDRRIKNTALGVFMFNRFLIWESELIKAIYRKNMYL